MLKKLGLKLPFEFGPRITEIVDSPNLYVSSVIHKSVVEVNEEGTEAAATGHCNFVADHPFLFVIREDVTGVMLFMGQEIHPS
ncbi:putative Serpin family protein [Helianthus annuus]|nr:putative Serpin family protein [Helianthus annuus]